MNSYKTIALSLFISLSTTSCFSQTNEAQQSTIQNMSIDLNRYEITTTSKSSTKVLDLPINNDYFCEFYVRLYSLLGQDPQMRYEGFSFLIHDKKNDFYFEAALTGFGAGYFAENNTSDTQALVNEFHNMLYSDELILKDCSLTYEHDFGTTTYAFHNGHFKCD